MGIANLQGAFAKLGRAKEHHEMFDKEIRMLAPLYTGTIRTDIQYKRGWYLLCIDPLPSLPQRLSLIIGDCLTNLRAVLDHVVWQFVLREDKEPTQRHSFPICEKLEDFTKKCKPLKKQGKGNPLNDIPVDGDAWTIIEQVQPFHCPKPQNHWLFLLNQLVNADKHRSVLVQCTILDKKKLLDSICWEPGIDPIDLQFPTVALSSEHPTEIARFRLTPEVDLTTNPCMDIKGELRPIPVIGDAESQVSLNVFGMLVADMELLLQKFAALPRVQK